MTQKPMGWTNWIPMAEWWYNTHHHSGLKTSPFEALYGYKPPYLNFHQQGRIHDSTTRSFCKDMTDSLRLIKQNLVEAQARIKHYADRTRSERSFMVGDLVFLRIKPYQQTSLTHTRFGKLSPKYFGNFLVLEKIGNVTYKLQLPVDAKIHPVFHVSLLKKCIGLNSSSSPTLPSVNDQGQFLVEPVVISNRS